jgi:hypothetical protein
MGPEAGLWNGECRVDLVLRSAADLRGAPEHDHRDLGEVALRMLLMNLRMLSKATRPSPTAHDDRCEVVVMQEHVAGVLE